MTVRTLGAQKDKFVENDDTEWFSRHCELFEDHIDMPDLPCFAEISEYGAAIRLFVARGRVFVCDSWKGA